MRGEVGPGGSVRSREELVDHLREGGPALVALSGGVDSAVVAALARAALGEWVLAATVVSSSVSSEEVASARAVARALGLAHRLVPAEPLDDARYRENGADRCYRCRSVETRALLALGAAQGVRQCLDGIHTDDLADDRPGLRAMDEAGFSHPLLWAGWRKADVRRHAEAMGLPNADRPSNACLASRVARGQPISAELLARIELAERFLLELGLRRVRVRVRGTEARVEVDAAQVERLSEPARLTELTSRLTGIGFSAVTIDPRGYRGPDLLPIVR